MDTHYDIIIVGAGILGASHAYFAAQKGHRVLLIEKDAYSRGATVRNFGMVASDTIVPVGSQWQQYAHTTREIYLSLKDKLSLPVRNQGSLYIANTEAEMAVLDEFNHHSLTKDTIQSQLIDKEKLYQQHPFLKPKSCLGGLYFPDDLSVESPELLVRFIDYLKAQPQITYLPKTRVFDVQPGKVETHQKQSFTADTIFICSGAEMNGPYFQDLVDAGVKLCKLQMMRTKPRSDIRLNKNILSGYSLKRYPAFQICDTLKDVIQEQSGHSLNDYGIHLLLKQSPDGSIIIGDSHEYSTIDSPEQLDYQLNFYINQLILDYAHQFLPLALADIAKSWVGYYLSHDEPILTQTVDEHVYLCTAIAGKGMSTGMGLAQANIGKYV